MAMTSHATSKITRAYMVASGDLRLDANRTCWPAQEAMERRLTEVFAAAGVILERAHAYDETETARLYQQPTHGHGRLQACPQRRARGCRRGRVAVQPPRPGGPTRPPGADLDRRQWSGQWPGLVGMLNLNGS
jgi:hypothetical protein